VNFLAKLTGGRPMKRGAHCFFDRVIGEDVFYYEDRLGREWIACSAWALFRVPVPVPKKVRDALLMKDPT